MKTPHATPRPLTLAVASALLAALAMPAFAQNFNNDLSPDNTFRNSDMSRREQNRHDLQDAAKGSKYLRGEQAEVEQLYPQATREAPEAKSKGKGLKALQALQETLEKQDHAAAIAQAEAIGANGDATPYEKSFAWQVAANAAVGLGDEAKAAGYFQKAIDANGLDNNSHYQVMQNLAVVQFNLGQYPQAQATIERFLAETKSENPEHHAFHAGVLATSGQADAAAKIYAEQLAKHPDDMKLRMNAVANYQSADQFDQANALLAEAYRKGLLTEANQYRALYVGYINTEKDKDALAVIDDGVAKGVIPPSPELARDLMVIAQNAFYSGSKAEAIALYRRAAPMAADGEAWLNLAMILNDEGKLAEAKVAAQAALDKGVKKPESAQKILAR